MDCFWRSCRWWWVLAWCLVGGEGWRMGLSGNVEGSMVLMMIVLDDIFGKY